MLRPVERAPGIVSTDAIELNGVFTPDGREFFCTRLIDGVDIMHHAVFKERNGASRSRSRCWSIRAGSGP
ncbi:MAG: hypothetical protein ACR2L2_09000 [Acidobacteriota bacterium]